MLVRWKDDLSGTLTIAGGGTVLTLCSCSVPQECRLQTEILQLFADG